MLSCSVIIRAYNEEKHIGKLLFGLSKQSRVPKQVILVDSGSTDRTVEIAKSFDVEVVSIKKSEFTFGRSLNIGCRAASGDILLMASAHVYPSRSTWIEEMLRPFENEQVEIVYGKQSGCETTKFSEHCIFRSWFPDDSDPAQVSTFCNNANCAVRRSTWAEQNYDESLTGLEDIAWADQLRKRYTSAGIYYNSDAEIIHVHDETFEQITNRYFRESLALTHIKPDMRMTLWDAISLFGRNAMSDSKQALKSKQFIRQFGSVIRFRAAQFSGAWRARRQNNIDIDRKLHERLYYPGSHSVRLPKDPSIEADEPSIIEYEPFHASQR